MNTVRRTSVVLLAAALMVTPVLPCAAQHLKRVAQFVSPHGYSLDVPAGWHILPHLVPGDDADVILDQQVSQEPRRKTPVLTIQFRSFDSSKNPVILEVGDAALESIQQAFLSRFRRRFSGLRILSQTFSVLGGARDIDCIFVVMDKGTPVRFHEVLIIRHSTVFTFTTFCPEQLYPKYASALSQMLASVRWKP